MTESISTNFPTIGNNFPQTAEYANMSSVFTASKVAKGHITNANPCLMNDPNGNDMSSQRTNGSMYTSLALTGYANNFRG